MPAQQSNFSNRFLQIVGFLFLLLVFGRCSSHSGRSFVPEVPGYDAREKEVFVLKKILLEVSGIYCEGEGIFAAMNDEDGKLFRFRLADNMDTIATYKFGKKGDYEDIAKVDSVYYIMESNGDLHRITLHDSGVQSTQFKFELEKKVEFESLVHYKKENKLILITKDHRLDEDAIYAFSFDLATHTFSTTPYFILPRRDVLIKMKDFSAEFKPSAAALHPVLNKLFIIASVGKVLVVATPQGKVEKVFKLNPSQFQQPEGITFASNGDMFVSNEGLQGKATILWFPFTPGR